MKKQLFLLVMLLLPMVACADTVEIDGIYYNLIPKGNVNVAEVTKNPNKYMDGVVIPEKVSYGGTEYSVTSIGEFAFEYCTNLTSVTIPNSVTNIGQLAFSNCTSLTSMTIPNNVTKIRNRTFMSCSGLTSVTIPNSVTSIEEYAFYGCSGLTSIIIPNSVTSIESSAFYRCSGLTSVTIGNSVTSLGWGAFEDCSSLTSVIIPNSVTIISDRTFMSCTGLTSVTIGNSVTSIGQLAFYSCTSLTSVTIPNSVTSIGSSAFTSCTSLTSVIIGSEINNIGKAFANCKNLENVYCHAVAVPQTNANAFENSYINASTLYVPAASINAYKTTTPWNGFGTFKSIEGGSTQKCTPPTISYGGKKLTFSCETEGVEYVYEIKDTDIKKGYDSEVSLTAIYEISVYATKQGYENSDIATATLVWGSASFTETTGTTSAIPLTHDVPMLIKSQGGMLTVEGVDDGQQVNVYGINGTEAGSAVSSNGQATVNTSLQPDNVAIVKVGDKSVKVIMR